MLREEALLTDLTVQPRSDPESFFKDMFEHEHLSLTKIEALYVTGSFSLAFPVGLGENFVLLTSVPQPPKTLRLLALSPKYQS